MVKSRNITLLIFGLFTSQLFANNILHRADSLYFKREFSAALYQYKQLISEDRFLKDDFSLNFKLGFCYYSNQEFELAYEVFTVLRKQKNILIEYVDYYQFLAALRSKNVALINSLGNKYLNLYKNHYLADSLRIQLADYHYQNQNYYAAIKYYNQLAKKRSFKREKSYLNSRIALCKYNLGKINEARRLMYQVIKKYSGSRDALELVNFLDQDEEFINQYFFSIADVYIAHDYFTVLRSKLENYVRNTSDPDLKEKARFYLLRVYYDKGDYKTALYGLQNMQESLRNKLLEPRIRLMIARSYLRLNLLDEAARAYVDYAEAFPRRRLADDAIWKAAWIYEEQGAIRNALEMYKKIVSHWPASAYSTEAKFRVGLSYYRLGWYANSEQVFKEIESRKQSTFHEHRAIYWLAKTYHAAERIPESDRLFIKLGGQVFESYYATKSYLMFREQVDALYHIDKFLKNEDNPLRSHKESQSALMEQFKFVFIIDELLGKEYAFKELERNRYRPESMVEWIGLAEIYKRLEAYNKAYRIYDHIDKSFYSELLSYEKPYILKEAYPLYYDNLVSIYTDYRKMDQNLVLALIRAESGYDRNAHSWADAYGLMQLIPRTANEVAEELSLNIDLPDKLFDPETNINLGTYYLNKLLKRFDNRVTYALAAYNAGPHRVDKWRLIGQMPEDDLFVENIEFSQTRNYVRKVLLNYWVYEILHQLN